MDSRKRKLTLIPNNTTTLAQSHAMTITEKERDSIAELLKTCNLPAGLGSGPTDACSIAAINLALTGKLTDEIPNCMSPVIGRWIIRIQDAMPDAIRNSLEWKALLPLAAGTGRRHEKERLEIILDWMWGSILTKCQHRADKRGYGLEWNQMTDLRTKESAQKARKAAASAASAADASAAAYAYASAAAADASAASAASAAAAYAAAYARSKFWNDISPPALLKKLIEVSEPVQS